MTTTRVILVVSLLVSGMARGQVTYEISQWDGSSWVSLGALAPYVVSVDAAAYYNFTGANPSFTEPAPPLMSDRSHLFLIDSAVDGLAVVFVHDVLGDGTGGRAETSWQLAGDPDGATWLVQDGPQGNDTYSGGAGASAFTAVQNWPAANSDGGIIGSLESDWSIDVAFTDIAGASGNEIVGLTDWFAFSGDGTQIPLTLVVDRPVRIAAITAPALTSDVPSVSLATAGTQVLTLDAGPSRAGRPYIVLGSVSGTTPGLVVPGGLLPLNVDFYFDLTLQMPNTPPLTGNLGFLDANGHATPTFTLPAGLPSSLAGLVLHHAGFVLAAVETTSHAVSCLLVP